MAKMLSASFDGVRQLEAKLKRVKERLDAAADRTLEEDANHIAEVIQSRAPVGETGELKVSVRVKKKRERYWQIIAGNVRTHAPGDNYNYARAAEFGTTKMKAEPFFFPTYRTLRAWHIKRMIDVAKEVIQNEN